MAFANEVAGSPLQLDENPGNAAGGDIAVGVWDADAEIFTATTSEPNAVRVVGRRRPGSASGVVDLYFGPAFGVDASDCRARRSRSSRSPSRASSSSTRTARRPCA